MNPSGRDFGGVDFNFDAAVPASGASAPVQLLIGHCDTAPWNIVARDGMPVALIDWEDVGWMPLANELASLIVFGHLAPSSVAESYGVAAEYVEAVERSTARHALYLYVYWLRRLLEDEAADPSDLTYAEATCERYFG